MVVGPHGAAGNQQRRQGKDEQPETRYMRSKLHSGEPPEGCRSLRRLNHVYRFPIDQRIRRILDHLRIGSEAVNDLHGGPIVLAQRHLDQLGLISIRSLHHRAHLQSMATKDQRGDGNDHGDDSVMHVHVNFGVGAGHELAIPVVDIDFYQQGA